jgi:hypothetical protein
VDAVFDSKREFEMSGGRRVDMSGGRRVDAERRFFLYSRSQARRFSEVTSTRQSGGRASSIRSIERIKSSPESPAAISSRNAAVMIPIPARSGLAQGGRGIEPRPAPGKGAGSYSGAKPISRRTATSTDHNVNTGKKRREAAGELDTSRQGSTCWEARQTCLWAGSHGPPGITTLSDVGLAPGATG